MISVGLGLDAAMRKWGLGCYSNGSVLQFFHLMMTTALPPFEATP